MNSLDALTALWSLGGLPPQALAGALWLATAITFQPKTYFGVQWTAYMIFMVLVGGLGTFEGAILGAVFMTMVPELLKLIVGWLTSLAG